MIGYHREDLSKLLAQFAPLRTVLSGAVVVAAIAFLWSYTHGHNLWPSLPALALGEDNKTNLTPARLLMTALYIQAFYILVTSLWKPLYRVLGWLLIPLGSASLWTFTGHIVAIAVLYNLPLYVSTEDNVWAGTLWDCLAILGIWASIHLYRRFRPGRTARAANPKAAAASD